MPPVISASNSKAAGAIASVSFEVISTVRGCSVGATTATNSNESNTSLTGGASGLSAKLADGAVVSEIVAEELPPS
jgi:hypothetical protein